VIQTMLSILGMNMMTAVGELRSVCDKWNYLSKRNNENFNLFGKFEISL